MLSLFAHIITFQLIILFRYNEIVLLSYLHYIYKNERFKFYIRIEFNNRNAFSVTSVLYILNRADFSLTSHFFNTTRLGLACLGRGIYTYINVFFLCT